MHGGRRFAVHRLGRWHRHGGDRQAVPGVSGPIDHSLEQLCPVLQLAIMPRSRLSRSCSRASVRRRERSRTRGSHVLNDRQSSLARSCRWDVRQVHMTRDEFIDLSTLQCQCLRVPLLANREDVSIIRNRSSTPFKRLPTVDSKSLTSSDVSSKSRLKIDVPAGCDS